MNVDDMILLSIDDHMIEPPGLFERHMEARYNDAAPKLINDGGIDKWVFQGIAVGMPGLNAVCSWPKNEWSFDPACLAEMRPSAYDMHQRVRDMNANGMLAGMNFPTFPGFAGGHLAKMPDRELTHAAFRAYNDYLIDELHGSYPGRFIPMVIVPFHDIDETVKELRRTAAKGAIAVSLPETPYGLGLPDFASGHWDPVFAAICELDMTACMHIGGGFGLVKRPAGSRVDDLIVLAPQVMTITCADIMLSGVLRRFPNLRIALSEGGIGWISFFLDRMERHMDNHRWTGLNTLPDGMTPTEVFRKHFLACFITDPTALRVRDRIGVETIAWECDFPHSDCTWPNSPEVLKAELDAAGCSDDDIDAIAWKNVSRFFKWDPFQHTPRDQATVGALRALAKGVDTSETSRNEYRRRFAGAS